MAEKIQYKVLFVNKSLMETTNSILASDFDQLSTKFRSN